MATPQLTQLRQNQSAKLDEIRRLALASRKINGRPTPGNPTVAILVLIVKLADMIEAMRASGRLPDVAALPSQVTYLLSSVEQLGGDAEAFLFIGGGYADPITVTERTDTDRLLAEVLLALDAVAEKSGISLIEALAKS